MEYLEYQPDQRLKKFVECYWSAWSDRPPFREQESLIPDGTIELLFNFGDNYMQLVDGKRQEVKGSHIIGIRKKALLISQTGKQYLFCIRFRLGGIYPFFKIPAHLFANGFYTLQELLGNELRELEEQLFDAKDNLTRVALTDNYLLKKLQLQPAEYLFADAFLQALLRSPVRQQADMRSSSIKALAYEFNTGYKMVERRFKQVLGISPTELLKILRFNRAVLAMYSCRHDSLTGIAYESGYYDQSHFIREFKQLVDLPPKEFLKAQFTIVQVIQPALYERMSKSYNFE